MDRKVPGVPWAAYVFVRYAGGRRSVLTLKAKTKQGIYDQLAELAGKRGVKILD